jgi:hypothetical protein
LEYLTGVDTFEIHLLFETTLHGGLHHARLAFEVGRLWKEG